MRCHFSDVQSPRLSCTISHRGNKSLPVSVLRCMALWVEGSDSETANEGQGKGGQGPSEVKGQAWDLELESLCSALFSLGDLVCYLHFSEPTAKITGDSKSCCMPKLLRGVWELTDGCPSGRRRKRKCLIGVSSLHPTPPFLEKPSMACSSYVWPHLQRGC